MPECCGHECTHCGKRAQATSLHGLLAHVRRTAQMAAHRLRVREQWVAEATGEKKAKFQGWVEKETRILVRWQAWGDALEELLKEEE
jgi:propanediol dehydratase large subunit